jgi:hypothetical protein
MLGLRVEELIFFQHGGANWCEKVICVILPVGFGGKNTRLSSFERERAQVNWPQCDEGIFVNTKDEENRTKNESAFITRTPQCVPRDKVHSDLQNAWSTFSSF